MVSRAGKAFDDERRLQDEAVSGQLSRFLADFAAYCDDRRGR
jgi:hypothetical protein